MIEYEIQFYDSEVSAAAEIAKVEAKQKELAGSNANVTSALASDIQTSMADEGAIVGGIEVEQATEPTEEAFDDSFEEENQGDGDESPGSGSGSSMFANFLALLRRYGVYVGVGAGALLVLAAAILTMWSRSGRSDAKQPLPSKGGGRGSSGPAIRMDVELANPNSRATASSVSFATNPMAKPVTAGALVIKVR